MASFPRRPARDTNWRQRNDSLSALEVYILDVLDFTIEVSMLAALDPHSASDSGCITKGIALRSYLCLHCSCIIASVRACMNGINATKIFKLAPPSLEEYHIYRWKSILNRLLQLFYQRNILIHSHTFSFSSPLSTFPLFSRP
jgi:hypothetical protein